MTENQEETSSLNIKPFTMVTSAQRTVMERFMEEVSGLGRRDFAVNSWGFPLIPIPRVRRASSRTRLAPTDVHESFIGHPIYWINPELTQFDPSRETEEEWSIRMFYLILGMGYWTEDLTWIDYIQYSGLEYDRGDLEAYHMLSNPKCKMDELKFLQEDDLLVPMEDIMDSYRAAIDRCSTELRHDLQEFLNKQAVALSHGKAILGYQAYKPTLSPDDADGFWMQNIEPNLSHLCDLYDNQFQSPSPRFRELVEPANEQFRGLLDIMMGINTIIATLTVPVIRQAETESDAYSQMTTYMALANKQALVRGEGYPLMEEVERVLGTDRSPGALRGVLDEGYSSYRSCWRRLRMAIANYERMQQSLQPFENYAELEVSLVGHQRDQVESHRSSLEDKFSDIDAIFDQGRKN